jgi:hypothetical protein
VERRLFPLWKEDCSSCGKKIIPLVDKQTHQRLLIFEEDDDYPCQLIQKVPPEKYL